MAHTRPDRRRGRLRSVLLSVWLIVQVSGCVPGTSAPSADSTPSASPVATLTPTPTRIASPEPSWPTKAPPGTTPGRVATGSLLPGEDNLAIEEFDDPSVFGGPGWVTLRYAVAVGTGFVVLGDIWHEVGATTGQAWLSPDGRIWERVDVPAMDGALVVNDFVATADGTLVAIGIGDAATGSLVWSSSDGGRAWQATRITDAAGSNMQLRGVVAGPRGLVMVGSTGSNPTRDSDTALWSSPDGQQWTRVPMSPGIFGDVVIGGIGATASGFVAVGGRWPAGEPATPDELAGVRGAAWQSADGLDWIETDVPDAGWLGSLVVGERTMLAAGYRGVEAPPQRFRSDAGQAWEPDLGWHDLWGPTESWSIFSFQGTLYQLGTSWSSGGPVLELWMSEDGDAWRRIGATVKQPTGGIGQAVPGKSGILTLGERNRAGVLYLMPWPSP